MTATIVNSGFKEERWVRMMALSFGLHLAVFSTTLFIPQTTIHYPFMGERVYHVELVGSPSRARSGAIGSPSGAGTGAKARGVAKGKGTSHILKDTTQRIAIREKKAAPIVAKRVSPKPMATYTNKANSPSGLIDRAISKIERKVEEEKTDHLKKALSEIERKVERDKTKQSEKTVDKPEGDSRALFRVEKGGGLSGLSRLSGMSSGIGKGIQLYQMEIEGAIKDNWSYPVALLDSRGENIPEAVIIVTVRSDGKILRIRFKRKSQNALFDESVLKAIEKSDPLPKFPPGYRKSHDEVEINFSLKDLVQY